CDKEFTEDAHLICHLRAQTGDKPYQCRQCDKAFTDNKGLIKHMLIHTTGKKPFQCRLSDNFNLIETKDVVKDGQIKSERNHKINMSEPNFEVKEEQIDIVIHTGILKDDNGATY
ncbi:unnamed protein product, partial [Meganyctiphanes norvegica]